MGTPRKDFESRGLQRPQDLRGTYANSVLTAKRYPRLPSGSACTVPLRLPGQGYSHPNVETMASSRSDDWAGEEALGQWGLITS